MTSAWYGKSSAKQLQQLLQSKPKLFQLLNTPDFLQQLKSYNTKLLDYVTNNHSIIGQAIEFMTTAPSINESQQRKYKYPLQVVEMVQSETTCVLNLFFKQVSSVQIGIQYFDLLFYFLQDEEVLPLIAGYFFRTNICLLNNRYKQSLDRVYLKPHVLAQMLNHSYLMPVINTIQLYLNLDVNKSSESDANRLEIKKDLIKKIIAKIQTQRKLKRTDSALIIQNLMAVLIQTIQKYYLILDGNSLIQILTSQQCIQTMLSLLKQSWEGSYPAFNFFVSLINYYSFSSLNSDDSDPQNKAKNLQRLEAQPMVIGLRFLLPNALDKVMKTGLITLYEYKLLEILCHCISISSEELFKAIRDTKFFACLINLMFKHEQNNILHMLVQKSFLHIFISERKIYHQYKKHLFCDLDIIQLTASRVLNSYSQDKMFQTFKKKTYFGHLMRILKIYSGIQTTQQAIINSIKRKTEVWNKISTCLIKPYESICFKELGSYENIAQGKYQQFHVSRTKEQAYLPNINPKPLTTSMIEEIRKQDQAIPLRKQDQISSILSVPTMESIILERRKQEQLLKSPTHNLSIDFRAEPRQIKKAQSFKQFMTKKKVQAQQQIKLKKSLSHQKRLSGGKIMKSSPKKNSWTQKTQQNTQSYKQQQSVADSAKLRSSSVVNSNIKSEIPRIPHYTEKGTSLNLNNNVASNLITGSSQSDTASSYRSYYGSSIQNKSQNSTSQMQKSSEYRPSENRPSLQAKTDKKMEIIKKIKVIRIEAPKQKKCRRLQEKDRILLDFLGITSGIK